MAHAFEVFDASLEELDDRNRHPVKNSTRFPIGDGLSLPLAAAAVTLRPIIACVNAEELKALPGGDLIAQGLRDLAADRETPASVLVEIGAPKLRQLGLSVRRTSDRPEHRLYALLARDSEDSAHSRYNALVRRLVSFERALACVS